MTPLATDPGADGYRGCQQAGASAPVCTKHPMLASNDARLKRSCARKSKYRSEAQARLVAFGIVTQSAPKTPRRLFVYPCGSCRKWHLTRTWNAGGAVTAEGLNVQVSQ